MKRMVCCLVFVLVVAFVPKANSTTKEEVAGIATCYFQGELSIDEALDKLKIEAENDKNDQFIRSLAYTNIASVSRTAGNLTKAREYMKLSFSLGGSIGAYEVLATIEAAEGNTKKALNCINEAIVKMQKPDDELERAKNLYTYLDKYIDAYTLHKEFQDNLFAAEKKYKDKEIIFRGNVSSIGRTLNNLPEITIKVELLKVFSCEMQKETIPLMSKIRKGQPLYMICRLKKGGEAIVDMKDCRFVSF